MYNCCIHNTCKNIINYKIMCNNTDGLHSLKSLNGSLISLCNISMISTCTTRVSYRMWGLGWAELYMNCVVGVLSVVV